MAVIPISFKESEAKLYRFLKSKVSPSAYIKELLYKQINNIEASINSPINNITCPTQNSNNIQDELYNIYCFKDNVDKDGIEFDFESTDN